jgi:hypothetical protein
MSYNQDNDNFEATDRFGVDGSSLVEEVAYDADSKELLVFFRSGSGYVYKNVPASTFNNFRTAHSKGQFYNNWVKRGGFGPGTEVFWDTEIVEKAYDAPSMTSVGTPTFAVNPKVGNTSYTMPSATFSLASSPVQSVPEKATLLHTVSFTVEGGNTVKTYGVDAESVADAVETLGESLDALGLDYHVKGVYVSFE